MVDYESMCPVCEEDIVIAEKDIKRARMHADEVGGLILVGCPNCCRTLVLSEDDLKDYETADEAETDAAGNESWLPCLELEGVVAKMPTGFESHMGVKEYKPGGGGKPLTRFAYMMTYGVDPVCALKKMGR